MKLETYLNKNYPHILAEYKQHERKDILPEIGTRVKLISWGHNGKPPGTIVKIVDIVKEGQISTDNSKWGGDYIVLSCGSLTKIEEWWKELEIVSK